VRVRFFIAVCPVHHFEEHFCGVGVGSLPDAVLVFGCGRRGEVREVAGHVALLCSAVGISKQRLRGEIDLAVDLRRGQVGRVGVLNGVRCSVFDCFALCVLDIGEICNPEVEK